jgi:tetratricopeptide (TPR) repeat protein
MNDEAISKKLEIQTDKAWNLIEMGRYHDAIPVVMDNIRAEPDVFYHYCQMAVIYIRIENYDEALKFSEQAVKLAPNHDWPYRQLSESWFNLNNPKRALEYAQTAVQIDPEESRNYYLLALSENQNGHFHKAIDAIETAIKLDPEEAYYHELVGNLYVTVRKYKQAEPHYMEALRHDPNDASIYNRLGDLYAHIGERIKAADYYLKAVKLWPDNDAYRQDLFNFMHHEIMDAPMQDKEALLQQFDPAVVMFYNDMLSHTGWAGRLRLTSQVMLWSGALILATLILSLVRGDDVSQLYKLFFLLLAGYLVITIFRFIVGISNKRQLQNKSN